MAEATANPNEPIVLGDDYKIQFGGVSTDFEPHPANDYPAVIEDSEVRLGQTSGEPYLNVTFGLTTVSGKQWNSYSLQPQALWRLKQMAIRIGCDPATFEAELTVPQIQEAILNRPCVLRLAVEEYKPKNWVEGDPLKKRNTVKDVFGEGQQAPAQSRRKSGF